MLAMVFCFVMRCFIPFLAVALTCPAAYAQTANDLATSLEKHNFVLRNYYTDDNLTFDSSGKLVSGGTPGFGPTDGLVEVEKVEIKRRAMTLIGQRPIYVWNAAQSEYEVANLGRKIKIEIDLPSTGPSDILPFLNHVFLPVPELQASKCIDTDIKVHDFALMTLTQKQSLGAEEPSETRRVCFPGGERAYFKAHGVQLPKPIHIPDPQYPDTARRDARQGTVILDFILDTSGEPTTLVISRPLGYGFEEAALTAVERWRFQPATLNGKAIPFATTVEVNFHLHP